jgi:hypothetical protein
MNRTVTSPVSLFLRAFHGYLGHGDLIMPLFGLIFQVGEMLLIPRPRQNGQTGSADETGWNYLKLFNLKLFN